MFISKYLVTPKPYICISLCRDHYNSHDLWFTVDEHNDIIDCQ